MSNTNNETLELYNLDISNIRSTFLGRPMAQSFAALYLFEKILLEQPFKRIIEFGTWKGNLSLYLLLYCLSENADFYTYDKLILSSYMDTNKKDALKEILHFKKYFYNEDIFKKEEEIKNIIRKEGQTILFCDNGNKKLEFNIFAPFLKKLDIIGVHDWNIEISLEQILEVLKENNYEMIFEKECIKYDNNIRFFKKRS